MSDDDKIDRDVQHIGKWEDDNSHNRPAIWLGVLFLVVAPTSLAAFLYGAYQLAKYIAPLIIAGTLLGCATAQFPPDVASQRQVLPPMGYIAMCLDAPTSDMCSGGTDAPRLIRMTPAIFAEIDAVNRYANALPEISDADKYGVSEKWVEPDTRDTSGGDCEDIAMLKRAILISHGLPTSALLIAVVKQWNDEGHTALIVRSDKGDFVLDNLRPGVDPISEAPYLFLKMQSASRPFVWVDMTGEKGVAKKMAPIGEAPFVAEGRGAGK